MAKLNTYPLREQLAATFQLIGIIPGTGTTFETVRLSNAALVAFVEQYAGTDGTNGKEVEMRQGSTHIEWRYLGDVAWKQLIAISELKGPAGEKIQLQKSSTAIQWKYESATGWTDLVALTELKGTDGTNGRTMWATTGAPSAALGLDGDFANDPTNSNMYGPKTGGSWGNPVSYKGVKGDTGTGLKNRGAWVTGTTYQPGDYVFSTGSATTSSMWILNGEVAYVSNTLPKDDPAKWVEFVAPAGADGVDGKNVEMRKTATVIQWRLVGDPAWIDLVTLADIKGEKGGDGTNGKTMLTASGVPGAGVGADGDYANDPVAQVMYGPKASGAWPAGVSYKGTKGNDGAAGAKWYVGNPVPDAGLGVAGDFYLRDNGDVYGPKTTVWGAVVAVLKGTKGDPGPGIPAGGTTGQVLTKKSATDGDTEWKTPESGGGGSGDVTAAGNNTFTGDNTFGANGSQKKTKFNTSVEVAGPMFRQATRTTHPASGNLASGDTTELPLGTDQIFLRLPGDLDALTIKLPAYAETGALLRVYVKYNITAVTIVTASDWQGPLPLIGSLTTMKPGWYEFQWWDDSNPGWYIMN